MNEMATKDIDNMRIGGKLLGKVFGEIKKTIKPGVSTMELNDLAEDILAENNAIPSFKGYMDYPAAICASPNDVVIRC